MLRDWLIIGFWKTSLLLGEKNRWEGKVRRRTPQSYSVPLWSVSLKPILGGDVGEGQQGDRHDQTQDVRMIF